MPKLLQTLLLLLGLMAVFTGGRAAEPAPLRIGVVEDPLVAQPTQEVLREV